MQHVIVNLHDIMTGMQYSEMYVTLAKRRSHRIPKNWIQYITILHVFWQSNMEHKSEKMQYPCVARFCRKTSQM